MRIAVIGAGNGGMAMAAEMLLKGQDVSLYDKLPQAIEGIQREKRIWYKGVLGEGSVSVRNVSGDMETAIRGAELIMVVTPAFTHEPIAREMSAILKPSQIVVLHPGRTGGALEFRKVVTENRIGFEPVIAEAQTLLYASRKTGPAEVTIHGKKKEVLFAALPARRNSEVASKLCAIFPEFKPASDTLEISLMNIGAVFHPTPCIFNAARIEDTKGDFEYYHQGITPAIGRILEKIDAERVAVARALGIRSKTTVQWLKDVYGAEGEDIYSSVRANKVYAGIKAPASLDTRYISEDVPMSLVPIAEFGKLAGIPTPTIDEVIDFANIIHRKDYREEGRTLRRLGIDNMSLSELKRMVG